ncbi:hypothetical protein [Roseivivax sp. CAU 1753]
MFETLAAFSVALLGGTLGSGLLSDNAEDASDPEADSRAPGPDDAAATAADAAAAHDIVLPNMDSAEPWFDGFDPEHDQVVVVFPDAMGAAAVSDLSFDYDEDYDETQVFLNTPDGIRPVCHLPGVAPGEMDAGNFDFMAESAARAHLGTATDAA